MSGALTPAIQQKIQVWKESLAEISLRNRLIKFRLDKQATVEIVATASQIFKSLIEEDISSLPVNNIRTNLSGDSLLKNLKKLRKDANSIQKEKGVNALFISLGTLAWNFKDRSTDPITSPLLLIPIELYKVPRRDEYEIRKIDDPFLNPALLLKLNLDYGINLDVSINEDIFNSIRKHQDICRDPSWRVEETVYISLFQSIKDSMIKDLEENSQLIAEHPVLRGLAGDRSLYDRKSSEVSLANNLDELDPQKMLQVLEADSSQQKVIEVAKAGLSFVVQGPPGTGKSQTITNIIAELVGLGKKVLLVAEKQVALDVVFRNLKQCGLEETCLSLHHRGTNSKKQFSKDLQQSRTQLSKFTNEQEEYPFYKLSDYRKDLNSYRGDLHKVWEPIGKSAFDLYSELIRFQKESIETPQLHIRNIEEWSKERIFEVEKLIQMISHQYLNFFRGAISTTWAESSINSISFDTCVTMQEKLGEFSQHINVLNAEGERLAKIFNQKIPISLVEVESFESVIDHVAKAPSLLPIDWYKDHSLPKLQQFLLELQENERSIQDYRSVLLNKYDPQFLSLNARETLLKLQNYRGLFRVFNPNYWITQRKIFTCRKKKSTLSYLLSCLLSPGKVISDLKLANELQRLIDLQNCTTYPPREVFEPFIKADGIDFTGINESLIWIAELEQYSLDTERVVAVLTNATHRQKLSRFFSLFSSAKRGTSDSLTFLQDYFSNPTKIINGADSSLEVVPLTDIYKLFNTLKSELDLFQQWLDYQSVLKKLDALGVSTLLDNLRSTNLLPEIWCNFFENQIYRNWLEYIHARCPVLRSFNSALHEKKIQEFVNLDPLQQEVAKQKIQEVHADRWRSWLMQQSANEELSLLDAESKKQKKHKEIRQFIKEAPGLVGTLKPCWLMSPLAVSQYIDPQAFRFDAVIFDEASQIRTEDAVPAMMRADQVIVVGDEQQLPPTAFFAGVTSSDDDEDDDDSAAYESLLAECGKLMSSNKFVLQWHYRSRDESLIAFSNQEFYRSELVSFPNPVKDSNRGVHFYYVQNGVYERGSKPRINTREAEAVAELALEHARSNSNQSLGIIAFSKEQADAIQDRIDNLVRQSSELAEFCQEESDKFFLKPLENVQGDERDVIILSFCYGKDSNGGFLHNFGPLTKFGGERRLNVAITRARYKLILVASIRSTDLDPTNKVEAVGKLKKYFEYVENCNRQTAENTNLNIQNKSPIIDDIHQVLEDKGYIVRRLVSYSEYPIELAISTKDRPKEFLLGIEVDGKIYCKYSTARDRDRLRPKVLKDLGWELYRIWSPEWFKNRDEQVTLLLERMEQIHAQSKRSIL